MISAPSTDRSARLQAVPQATPDKTVEDFMRELYGANFERHGHDATALFHADGDSQAERFNMLTPLFARETGTFTVHEIGPAFGDYGDYLRAHLPGATFSGSDIYAPFIDICRNRFPDGEFFVRNIVDELPAERYDYVVLFGTFNVPGDTPRDAWHAFQRSMLRAMYNLCRKGMGATFLTSYYDPGRERADLHYTNEKDLMDFTVCDLSRHFEIDGMGPLYEYSLRVYRPEYVRSHYPQPAFDKYFRKLQQ